MADIRLQGIAKSYGDIDALRALNLDIPAGQFLGILGPSGCGKTTLLRCLAGLETPDQGSIAFGGDPVFDARRHIDVPPHSRGIGMVFQDLALWPHLTVFENVAFTLRARKDTKDLRDRVQAALVQVRLSGYDDRYPHQLSGGQQQRVAFARAVVHRPAVLFMDEPLSALDAALRIDLRAELTALTKELGLTAVYVTHDQAEAMSMSDRILVMEDGHVRQDGAPEEIYQRPLTWFVAGFVGRLNLIDDTRVLLGRGLAEVHANGSAGEHGPAGTNGVAGERTGHPTATITGGAGGEVGPGISAGVRPEKVRLSSNGGREVTFEATVEWTSYLGDRYELHCSVADCSTPWVVYGDQRLAVGDHLTLHVAGDDLIVTGR